ncbi:MAG: P1 family peptidase [Eubacteriales bacterium]|jgi:D-aminopeptidase|nr:P1 family peptidase [Eubacteriales bacterium]
MKNKRIRDYGIRIGKLETGKNNLLTDVAGVLVGHITIDNGQVKTGVTTILPHARNIFREKVLASCHVINGFGKAAGLMQIEEMGTIETPIVLVNTLSVGVAYDALVDYLLSANEDIGVTTGTVNPVVCECNDGFLNDIRGKHLKKEHVFASIKNATVFFEEGAVGAGTGMSCFGFKGGIGSASRRVMLDGKEYVLGVLVLSNFGVQEDLTINGLKFRRTAENACSGSTLAEGVDKGSAVIVVAMDIPLTERQLKRVLKRAVVGLCRVGSFLGNTSGEVVVGFTTANNIYHYQQQDIRQIGMLYEERIDDVFRAAAEATEESVLNSLVCSERTIGRDNNLRDSLKYYLDSLV